MINQLKLLFVFLLIICQLDSAPPPVSLTFMIADLKHSEAEGIKICELQSGSISAFRGYDWLVKEPGTTPRKIADMLQQFDQSVWVVNRAIVEKEIIKELEERQISFVSNISKFYGNKLFLKEANFPVEDPDDIGSYPVLVIADPRQFKNKLKTFQKTFPNVIILDSVIYPYWLDKNKMSQLFNNDPLLEQVKPFWKVFNRTLTTKQIEVSHTHFSTQFVVIKPLHSAKGNGVIIIERNELPEVLELICHQPNKLSDHPNEEYRYWSHAKDQGFLIEEFHFSDPVTVSHLDNQEYDPTLRISFMIWHEHGEIFMDFVELHWKLPCRSLSDGASFMEKHKSKGDIPHFALVESEREEAIKQQLRETIPLIYSKMLGWK